MGKRIRKTSTVSTLTGRLSMHRDGFGFVTPVKGGEDIFVAARNLRENMHGDLVEVMVVSEGRSGRSEGRIVRTVERGQSKIVGIFETGKPYGRVIPDESRIPHGIIIPMKWSGNARDGEVVVVEITSYPTVRRGAEGRIVEVLGWPDRSNVEALSVIRKHGLPDTFPDIAVEAAESVPAEVDANEIRTRVDLREFVTFTIDGETARDFDDAVSIRSEGGGAIRLWVSIADVSHYVHHGSPLDAEAFQRGTSVYFPDRCIPMLPEKLSNGICSLNPGADRLTMTVEMLFGRTGTLKESSFYPGVIRSCARLTYGEVKRALVDKELQLTDGPSGLLSSLTLMEKLANRLMEKRRKRGSIDFDLPEPEILVDLQGETLDIVRAERNIAHRMIEEFMVAANEAVASFLEGRGLPSIYRVHEPPDPLKLNDFREFLHNFGYEMKSTGETVKPGEFQRILDEAEGRAEERMINEVMLRCMKQARYASENLGHYGLASKCYTHFTSPIRRYPDLVVHRILKRALKGGLNSSERERLEKSLPEIAAHASRMERRAMEAEREIVDLKKMHFMMDKVGEDFDGVITGIMPFGFFVELSVYFVEGLVHVSSLPRDNYRQWEKQHALVGERSRRIFRIGDRIRVKVASVNPERRQIDFSPLDIEKFGERAEMCENCDDSYIIEGRKGDKIGVKSKKAKGEKKQKTFRNRRKWRN